ncbi:hypothetical protein D1872_261640 [compost metagenome]
MQRTAKELRAARIEPVEKGAFLLSPLPEIGGAPALFVKSGGSAFVGIGLFLRGEVGGREPFPVHQIGVRRIIAPGVPGMNRHRNRLVPHYNGAGGYLRLRRDINAIGPASIRGRAPPRNRAPFADGPFFPRC